MGRRVCQARRDRGRHEAEVRERLGKSMGNAKGGGRKNGGRQERGMGEVWCTRGGREEARGAKNREKTEISSSKSESARCKVRESVSVKEGEGKWELTGLGRRSGRVRR